ncbi:MAG: signal recognition particle protein [Anaerolineales bacterium]
MFESLTQRMQSTFRLLARRGRLRPEDVDAALKEIRLALLEADVHYKVVKELLEIVRERALSAEVARALNPAQQVIVIVQEVLVKTLGQPVALDLTGDKPRIVMLVGLQGAGKTTTAAKLARLLKTGGERVWLVAVDPYRPAAAEQLVILGEEIKVPVSYEPGLSPLAMSESGFRSASNAGASVVILDTAGRSQIDENMMDELESIRDRLAPVEILLVADAMTGQEAVNIAQGFREALDITGIILTKMDGDARGGAAISMRAVTGVPIKFIGVGEARDAIEIFDPERLASRILGMGDISGLVEKAQAGLDPQLASKQVDRLRSGEFTLEDFLEQIAMIQRIGPFGKVLSMLPGGLTGGAQIDQIAAEKQLNRTKAMIQSMTVYERQHPQKLNASRKRRVAAGSGTTVQEVNQLLRQYRQMQRLLKSTGSDAFRGLSNLM